MSQQTTKPKQQDRLLKLLPLRDRRRQEQIRKLVISDAQLNST